MKNRTVPNVHVALDDVALSRGVVTSPSLGGLALPSTLTTSHPDALDAPGPLYVLVCLLERPRNEEARIPSALRSRRNHSGSTRGGSQVGISFMLS